MNIVLADTAGDLIQQQFCCWTQGLGNCKISNKQLGYCLLLLVSIASQMAKKFVLKYDLDQIVQKRSSDIVFLWVIILILG